MPVVRSSRPFRYRKARQILTAASQRNCDVALAAGVGPLRDDIAFSSKAATRGASQTRVNENGTRLHPTGEAERYF